MMTMTRDCSARPGWCRAGRESTIAPSRQEQHREERMKVTRLETLRCGAGWRNYNFLKLSTDEGIVGWSEFDEGFGSPGVGTVIEQLAGRVIGRPVYPELNVDKNVLRNLRMHLEALDDGAGPDIDLLLDLNFNAKTEGYLKILRALADFDMFWIEIDSYSPEALGYIRRQSPHPISSCETLCGLREFLPYLREQAMDVAISETVWNGVRQSMNTGAAAEAHEMSLP